MKVWTPPFLNARAQPWAGRHRHETKRGPTWDLSTEAALLFPSSLSQDFPSKYNIQTEQKHFLSLSEKNHQPLFRIPRLGPAPPPRFYGSCVADVTSSSREGNTQTRFAAEPCCSHRTRQQPSPFSDNLCRAEPGGAAVGQPGHRWEGSEEAEDRTSRMPRGAAGSEAGSRGALQRGQACGQLTSALCRSPRSGGRAAPPPCPTAQGSSTASQGSPHAAVRTPGLAAPSLYLQGGAQQPCCPGALHRARGTRPGHAHVHTGAQTGRHGAGPVRVLLLCVYRKTLLKLPRDTGAMLVSG